MEIILILIIAITFVVGTYFGRHQINREIELITEEKLIKDENKK